jgi:protein TonB
MLKDWVRDWEKTAPAAATTSSVSTGRGGSAPLPPTTKGAGAAASAAESVGKPTASGRAALAESSSADDYALFLTWSSLVQSYPSTPEGELREMAGQRLTQLSGQYGGDVVRRAAQAIKAAPKSASGEMTPNVAEELGCVVCADNTRPCPSTSCFNELVIESKQPRRVGMASPLPRKIKHVYPDYDPTPLRTRVPVARVVIVELTVGTNGAVTNARVVGAGSPFDKAALDAVRQWQYDPTGMTKPVTATVSLTFGP